MNVPPAVSYSVRRLALFGATLVLCAALLRGTPFLLVLLIATLVSGVLSYFLLAGSRERMAVGVAGRVQRLSQRLDKGAAAEDAELDAAEQGRLFPDKGSLKPE
ncbi:MAG TPA: DUF4229 domain-containing protein [Sporichthya sp.]|nr:DUF4229 domain-containing protein [Sporichthya sp.]